MGKKDELIEKAKNLDIELDSNETIADLEAKIAAQEAEAMVLPGPMVQGELARRRVNRGSRRRIERALSAFQKASREFAKELDLQLFMADEKGERIGAWPVVEDIGAFRQYVTDEINAALNPPAEDQSDD